MRPLPAVLIHRRPQLAWAIFLLGLIVSLLLGWFVARSLSQKNQVRFEQEATEVKDRLEVRLQAYTDVLHGVRGLCQTTPSLTRKQYLDYLESLELPRRYPGILGITYGVKVDAKDRSAFIEQMQRALGSSLGGKPFTIFPDGDRPEYFVVIYGAPESLNRGAIGFDSGSRSEQAASLHSARDTGLMRASPPVTPMQDPHHGPGLILRLAIYKHDLPIETVEQRRKAFQGYVNAVFLVRDLVTQSLGDHLLQSMDLQILDRGQDSERGDHSTPIYGSSAFRGSPESYWMRPLETQRELWIGDRAWVIRVLAKRGYVSLEEQLRPLVVMLLGLLFSGLMFWVIRFQNQLGERAEALANRMIERLGESESQMQAITRVIPDILYILDEDGFLHGIYTADESKLMAPKAVMLTRNIRDFLSSPLLTEVMETIGAALLSGEVQTLSYERDSMAGHCWFEARVAKIESVLDGKRCVAWIARDITERKRTEEHQQQAQRLESLGILAGGIAHDFNNLLTAILANLNLAEQHVEPGSPTETFLKSAEKTVLKASELTKQMLVYSGKAHVMVKLLDLNTTVQEMAQLIRVSISKKISLNLQLTKPLPSIQADPAQIQQLILNLVINASDAIGNNPGQIDVSTQVVDLDAAQIASLFHAQEVDPGRHVLLEVADSGCGMGPEVLAKIFDPFFTTKASGRGLGLSAMMGILKSHGGCIQVQSTPGHGTTFRLYFPVALGVISEPLPPKLPSDAPLEGCVLLVDDEASIRASTGLALEHMGLRVLSAQDGEQAVELFQSHHTEIDLVLMDLTMPRMDGLEAFERMRRIQPQVRVILCSGYSEQGPALQDLGKEACGFIQKPYRLKDLREALRDAMKE